MSNSAKRATTNSRHIPSEIVEEILYSLPVKSLLRFSSVSKSWNSMISEAGFIKKYGRRTALPDRERILITAKNHYFDCSLTALSYSIFTNDDVNPAQDKARFVCPLPGLIPYVLASCDQLWCVRVEESLFLWNPSMRTYRKLPQPIRFSQDFEWMCVYGLGYDSIGDDYKIVRICPRCYSFEVGDSVPNYDYDYDYDYDASSDLDCDSTFDYDSFTAEFEVYSLRSNSWRRLDRPPLPDIDYNPVYNPTGGAFVSGALHWLADHGTFVIISFDLSTEKNGVVAVPESLHDLSKAGLKINAVRGMLCLSANFSEISCLSIWMMEDYGVGTSWTEKYKIDYSTCMLEKDYFRSSLRLVYVYNNGHVLIEVVEREMRGVFLYRPADCSSTHVLLDKDLGPFHRHRDVYAYVESLVSLTASSIQTLFT